jgi:hypothetical protein
MPPRCGVASGMARLCTQSAQAAISRYCAFCSPMCLSLGNGGVWKEQAR